MRPNFGTWAIKRKDSISGPADHNFFGAKEMNPGFTGKEVMAYGGA